MFLRNILANNSDLPKIGKINKKVKKHRIGD